MLVDVAEPYQARGVTHQVVDGHRPRLRLERHLDRPVGILFLNPDLGVGELGDVLRHRLGERELALFRQHHGGKRDDRLGHRRNAEDRVVGHRRPGLLVAETERLVHHGLAVACDQHDRARQLAHVDADLDAVAQPLQALLREADLLGRLHLGQDALRGGGGSDGQSQRGNARATDQRHISSFIVVPSKQNAPACARAFRPWQLCAVDAVR